MPDCAVGIASSGFVLLLSAAGATAVHSDIGNKHSRAPLTVA